MQVKNFLFRKGKPGHQCHMTLSIPRDPSPDGKFSSEQRANKSLILVQKSFFFFQTQSESRLKGHKGHLCILLFELL